MKDILAFMGEHPFLTFFLACIAGECIVRSFQAFAAIFRGWPPPEKDEDGD